jgi:mono/diheme cytochrome c family protein
MMITSETSPARIRSKGWSWIPSSAAAIAIMLASASIPTVVRAAEVDLKAAASNFSDSCVDCHGESGKGNGKKAADLKTKPADYTDCAKMSKFTDDYLFNVIKNGGKAEGKSKEMPDFGKAYDDDEIHSLVAYVRTFCKK